MISFQIAPSSTPTVKANQCELSFMRSLNKAPVTHVDTVQTVSDLLMAEEVLDDLANRRLDHTLDYQSLLAKCAFFLASHPEVYMQPWLRNGGAVYDLVHNVKDIALKRRSSTSTNAMLFA